MSQSWPERVEITEVGPRDGFQNIREWIPTETKLIIIEKLLECGFEKMEVTAFVHPKAVPQMADAKEILKELKPKYPNVAFIALAPNIKGAMDAIEAGVDEAAYIISASERHNFENTKQTIEQSLAGLSEVCKLKSNTKIRLALPTSFICPWTGKVAEENVIKIIERGAEMGITEFGLGDTIGSANPLHVQELFEVLKTKFPELDIILHLHDTRGMGLASVLMALQAGATRFETAIGGLGGCPFAPGAAGNIATEDLVNMLEGMGIRTGINLKKMMQVVFQTAELLPVPLNSRMLSADRCAVHLT